MADESTTQDASTKKSDEKLLIQLREDFRYAKSYWSENYDESAKDMLCMACIPPPEFAADRAGRPCIWPDEVSQYVKQSNNNLRQNKRSAKISPRSEDATDEDAEHRQAYIQGIEYASKAQSIYSTAYEAATECGMGFWRVNTRVVGPKGEQEPRVVRIPNQFTVYPDPDAKERDFSDSSIYFVLDAMREKTFVKRWGKKAKKRSFSGEDRTIAGDFFNGDNIIVVEYWVREELEAADGEKTYKVTQYISNGVEILETNEWIGSWIPIIGVFGEELYIRKEGISKRMFLSLIRRARGPQTMLAYVASQEAEEFGMAPAAPLQGYKGQFDPELHKDAHKVPRGYMEFLIPTDWNPQWGPPPLPTRNAFSPNTQAFEMAFERWRRSIQAAMGISPLPTAAQRQNEKSGVALEKIQDQEAIGSFHFTDNFVGALNNSTRQINELITKLAELDSLPKQVMGRDQKDEDLKLQVVPQAQQEHFMQLIEQRKQAQAANPESEHLNEADYFFAHRGQFEVTISDGPNYDSERDAQSDFADKILETVKELAQVLPPGAVAKMLALAVKMRNLGSVGDEMVDVLVPTDQSAQQLQAAQQQLAMAQQAAQQMQTEIEKLKLEKAGKVIDNQFKMQIEQMRGDFNSKIAQLDADLKAYIANVQTKAQSASERERLFQETQNENHHSATEIALQKDDQAHQHAIADKQAAVAAASQTADQVHQQTMAEQKPDPDSGTGQ